ncbi:MAG: RNA polymerase sigma factor [Paenibacillaceae bacterium]|nr:RNA polymerase sigma factor [Paenibacillaceae bacterium]
MHMVSDEQLMQDIVGKNRAAFEQLYDRYVRLVYSYALKSTRDEQAARDVVQLVFARLWTTERGYNAQKGRFVSWLLTVTRNITIDYIRRERKHGASVSIEPQMWEMIPDPKDDPETLVDRRMFKEKIEMAYAHLSENQIELIEQVYWQGYTLGQIAEMKREPLGTIKSRLHQTLKRLRRYLGPEGGDEA